MKLYHYILLIASLTVTLAGCSSDEPAPTPSGEACELVVTLVTDGLTPEASTFRAVDDEPWGKPYPEEPGVSFENAVSDVNVYFITPEGLYFGLQAQGSGGTSGKYTYRTKVNVNEPFVKNLGGGNYSISGRIVAVANYPGQTPASPFNMPAFDISSVRERELIPMWGVTTVTDLPMRVNETSDAGSVKLLRAVPKITIMMEGEFADMYKITKVVADEQDWLDFANCTPANAASAPTTDDLMREGCFNPSDKTEYSDLYFYGLGTDKVWCYPAERVGAATAKPLSLTVTLARKDGTAAPFTGKVYLCDYASGKPDFSTAFPSLVRNHDYQYKISLSELEFIISFKKWIFGGKVHLELE